MRRNFKKQNIRSKNQRQAVRTSRRNRLENGRRGRRSKSNQKLFILHRSLQSAGTIERTPHLSDMDTKQRSLDIFHAAGVSVSNSTKINKRTYSLIKEQTAPRIVQNPLILQLDAYKNVTRVPLKANQIFKNSKDPFFNSDTKLSRVKYNQLKVHIQNPKPDLASLVNASIDRYTGPQAPKNVVRGWAKPHGTNERLKTH